MDYENGSENGGIECEECASGRTGFCSGRQYITGLCYGKPFLDDGKNHNHCNRCSGFGSCLGDYRNRDCRKCRDEKKRKNTAAGGEPSTSKRKKVRRPKSVVSNITAVDLMMMTYIGCPTGALSMHHDEISGEHDYSDSDDDDDVYF